MKRIILNLLFLVLFYFTAKYVLILSFFVTVLYSLTFLKDKSFLLFYTTWSSKVVYAVGRFLNIFCRDLFNLLLIKSRYKDYINNVKFGVNLDSFMTILDINKDARTLTKLGFYVHKFLSKAYTYTK